jgi:cell shape-determining protein MreD
MNQFVVHYALNGILMGFAVMLTDFLHRNNPQHDPAPFWLPLAAIVLWPFFFLLALFFLLRKIVLLAWRGRPEETRPASHEEAQKGEHHDQ